VRKADNLPPSCAADMKSGDLNILEHSGPLQDCNGNALPSVCLRKEGVAVFGGRFNVDIRKVWFIFICTAYQCYNDR